MIKSSQPQNLGAFATTRRLHRPVLVALLFLLPLAGASQTATALPDQPSSSLGGAGAFIPPSHSNGVFGAGGPLSGIGGAGAFIPGP